MRNLVGTWDLHKLCQKMGTHPYVGLLFPIEVPALLMHIYSYM